ncbi:MAG TPA: hypothetical protein EYM84_04230 [Flavobacteriales bacterium]|nr:hypothetical protein [Flavobacteriales bacterium]
MNALRYKPGRKQGKEVKVGIHKILTLLLLFLSLASFSTYPYKQPVSEDTWELKKDEENIKVFVRNYKNTNLLEFKAETEISSRISCLISVIHNIDEATLLFAASKKAELIKKIDEKEWIIWSFIDVPFPFDDRDMVARMKLTQDIDSKIVTIDISGEPDYIPERSKKVRIPLVDGSITYIPIDKNTTKVIYQNVTDPGGLMPAWLINMGVIKAPFETLQNYKRLAEKEIHQNAVYDFIDDYK